METKLVLTRYAEIGGCTISELDVPGAPRKYAILEPAWKKNKQKISCIPLGTYPLKLEYSNKFKRDLWELKDVPNRSEIKIHSGNTRPETDGCLLIGMKHGKVANKPAVFESIRALKEFTNVMTGKKNVTLEVIEAKA